MMHDGCGLCKKDDKEPAVSRPALKDQPWPHIKRALNECAFMCFRLKLNRFEVRMYHFLAFRKVFIEV